MKQVILTTLITSILLLPLGSTALADHEEAPVQPSAGTQAFLPGDVPAELTPADSMGPALHGIVLAMLNHDVTSFDLTNTDLAWESLYNMLSLYGQLDSRSEISEDLLLLRSETAQDYAAALDITVEQLPPLPASLKDRLTYDRSQEVYHVVCGSDALAQIQVQEVQSTAQGLRLTGALVYVVDNEELAQFQATLQLRDNMFGYAVTSLTLG